MLLVVCGNRDSELWCVAAQLSTATSKNRCLVGFKLIKKKMGQLSQTHRPHLLLRCRRLRCWIVSSVDY